MPGARGGETPPADEKRILQGNLISLQGNNDTKESSRLVTLLSESSGVE